MTLVVDIALLQTLPDVAPLNTPPTRKNKGGGENCPFSEQRRAASICVGRIEEGSDAVIVAELGRQLSYPARMFDLEADSAGTQRPLHEDIVGLASAIGQCNIYLVRWLCKCGSQFYLPSKCLYGTFCACQFRCPAGNAHSHTFLTFSLLIPSES